MSAFETRILAALDKIVRSIVGDPVKVPGLRFFGRYTYRIVLAKAGPTYDLQAVDKTLGLPDLAEVPAWPSLAGSRHVLALSSLVIVDFLDGNPATPIISAHEGPGSAGHFPSITRIDVGGGGTLPFLNPVVVIGDYANTVKAVALDGDTVNGIWLMNIAGVLTAVAANTPGAVHVTGTVTGTALKLWAEKT